MLDPSWVKGADLSHWQPSVDFAALAGQVAFVYLKATDGLGSDPTFPERQAAAIAVGLPVGAYHFYRAEDDAQNQAKNFAKVTADCTLPPVLDVERGTAALTTGDLYGVTACLDYLETFTGKRPMIYTSIGNWQALGNPTGFAEHDLWVARYAPEVGTLPASWTNWTLWQYSQSGSDNGVGGPVDTDVFQGDLSAFQQHFGIGGQ